MTTTTDLDDLRARIDEDDDAHTFAPGINEDGPCVRCDDDESALAHVSDNAERERQRAVILAENGYTVLAARAEALAVLLDAR